jgi:hypothetical protein
VLLLHTAIAGCNVTATDSSDNNTTFFDVSRVALSSNTEYLINGSECNSSVTFALQQRHVGNNSIVQREGAYLSSVDLNGTITTHGHREQFLNPHRWRCDDTSIDDNVSNPVNNITDKCFLAVDAYFEVSGVRGPWRDHRYRTCAQQCSLKDLNIQIKIGCVLSIHAVGNLLQYNNGQVMPMSGGLAHHPRRLS